MRHMPGMRSIARAAKVAVLLLVLGVGITLAQGTDLMTGSFTDGFLTIHISGQNGQYSGRFEAGGNTYPFTASGNAQRIDGTYQDAGQLWQFSAVLQGNSLTFQNAAQAFQLGRITAAPQQPPVAAAAGSFLPAGTRLTYNHVTSSTPGPNAGPDARGVAGQGYLETDIHYSDATACVASVTMYARGLTSDTLTVVASDFYVTDGSFCSYFWISPALLAAYQPPAGGTETVERGPFQQGGRTYNSISINNVYQNMRSWRIYDLDSGMLLSFVEGTGDRNNPDGTSQGPSTSGVQELVNVRQVNWPWSSTAALPAHLQNLQSLHYKGQRVQSMPGITMIDTATTTYVDSTFTVQQRGAAWLQVQASSTMTMMGVTLEPIQRQTVANANSGLFLLPSAMAQLQTGQVLDTDPITGYRMFVERADQSGVVLVTEGRGYRLAATFEAGTGLMRSSQSETQEDSSLRTVTMELVSWQ